MARLHIDSYITHGGVINGTTLKWFQGDSEKNFLKNRSEYKEKLNLPFPWDNKDIDYRINKHGFRGDEIENINNGQDTFIALGCSITFGQGVSEEQTWPSQLGRMLGMKHYNFGAPGRGYETSFRLLNYWLPILKPKYVFMFVNPGTRREYFNQHAKAGNGKYMSLGAWSARDNNYTDHELEMFLNERDSEISRSRALYAITGLCNTYNTPLDISELQDDHIIAAVRKIYAKDLNSEKARDMEHPGVSFHEKLAKDFFRMHTEKFDTKIQALYKALEVARTQRQKEFVFLKFEQAKDVKTVSILNKKYTWK